MISLRSTGSSLLNTILRQSKPFGPRVVHERRILTGVRSLSVGGNNKEGSPPSNEAKNSQSFQEILSSMRNERPGRRVIVEPPIRTRPFRNFRGAGGAARLPQVRKSPAPTPRRMVLQSSGGSQNHGSYPVQAIHVAQSINLAQVISKVFATRGVRRMMERLSVVVQLPPEQNYDDEKQSPRFVAVFRFGSAVFFNVSPRDIADLLWRIKECSKDPYLSGNERKENFCVHVQNGIPEEDEVVTGEYCVVEELNLKAVDVISNVMAQSVALDSYNDTVDELLANFEIINDKVTTGESALTTADRDQMFVAVARNNSIFIEMVSKVGLKDRSDTAWNLSQYENIHDGMKEEFDIDQRFEHIEFKLNLIQENAKFFLEVMSHQKSNSLEWIIIVLIMFECVLMCMEMSGAGPAVFEYLSPGLKPEETSEAVSG
jgi:uncharacterized Rmd1/YagE family protein